jgi:hypothetical protein
MGGRKTAAVRMGGWMNHDGGKRLNKWVRGRG